MKTLSLKQLFVELIFSRKKTIEFRKGSTKSKGNFLINISKILNLEFMKKFGFFELSFGKIVEEAGLINLRGYENGRYYKKGKTKHFMNFSEDGENFILRSARKISLIKSRGKLNFWELNLNEI